MLLRPIRQLLYGYVKTSVLRAEYVKAGAKLPQVIKRIGLLKDEYRQQYDRAYIWY
jgi:hypothetical protein